MTSENKIMDLHFSLFNCHINDAFERSKAMFIKRWSQLAWDQQIQPFVDKGIMSILQTYPDSYAQWFVECVWIFVNENRGENNE